MRRLKSYLAQIGVGGAIVAVILWRTLLFDRVRFAGMRVTVRAPVCLLAAPGVPGATEPVIIDSGAVLPLKRVVFGRNQAFLEVTGPGGISGYLVKDSTLTVK